MSPYIGLFFDVVIIAALGVTIFHCLRLSRQFNQMQADRKAFEGLIQSLNVAIAKAEAAIRSIKDAAVGSGEVLQEKIGRARALSDELEIIIQAGDSLADRLNVLAQKGRQANAGESGQSLAAEDAAEIQPRTRAEKELLEAIRAKQKS